MGGVGPMIGTSASKRGWSGRGHMRARVEGLVVGERKLQTNGAPCQNWPIFLKSRHFSNVGGRFQCVEQGIPIRWH